MPMVGRVGLLPCPTTDPLLDCLAVRPVPSNGIADGGIHFNGELLAIFAAGIVAPSVFLKIQRKRRLLKVPMPGLWKALLSMALLVRSSSAASTLPPPWVATELEPPHPEGSICRAQKKIVSASMELWMLIGRPAIAQPKRSF